MTVTKKTLFFEEKGFLKLDLTEKIEPSYLPLVFRELWELVERKEVKKIRLFVSSKISVNSFIFVFIKSLERLCSNRRIELDVVLEDPKNKELIDIFGKYFVETKKDLVISFPKSFQSVVTHFGDTLIKMLASFLRVLSFTEKLLFCLLLSLKNPRSIRWKEFFYIIQQVGANAMAIVAIMSFLIGVVTAFQAAVQLRLFGANIFVADLSALALSRELSPLITAVLLAGRTTSSFAAEIGTMKINEEIDALKVMNVDVYNFLIFPRIAGTIISSPLLTFWSLFTGLLGGLLIAMTVLDVTPSSFISEVYGALRLKDLWVGFLKSFLFGAIVGTVGCFMGMETGYSPESVGKQTTSAVVIALFLIIVADAFVTVLAHVFKW